MIRMFYRILVVCVFTMTLLGCRHKEKVSVFVANDMKDSCLVSSLSNTLDMNSYVDSLSFISLDDSDANSFIKDINKCIIKNDRIYILDFFGTESVKVFDLSGKFLFMVGAKGGGPGEFFRTFDFDVNDNGIYLLDVRNRKIIEYALDNSFREEYRYDGKLSGINSFFVTNQSNFVLGMDKEIYDDAKVLLVNQELEIIQHILPFNEKDTQGQLKIGSFRRCGDNIVFYYPVSDDIYLFEKSGELGKKYSISLNAQPIPDEIRSDYNKVVSERKLGGFNYFHESVYYNGNLFLATMFYGSSKALFCLDIVNQKYIIKSYEGIMELFKKLSIRDFNFPVYADNNQIVCAMNQMIYEKIEEKEMIDPAYIEMLKEGGTLLLVYHLRNDKTHE